jgi:hypothetical protein
LIAFLNKFVVWDPQRLGPLSLVWESKPYLIDYYARTSRYIVLKEEISVQKNLESLRWRLTLRQYLLPLEQLRGR